MKRINKTKKIGKQKKDTYGEVPKRLSQIKEVLQNGRIIQKAKQYMMLQDVEKLIVYPQNQIEVIFKEEKNVPIIQNIIPNRSMIVPYIHKDNIYKRREKTNQQLLQIFRENSTITLKEVFPMFEVKSSYINTSIKQLKQEKKLVYQRSGNEKGKWIVTDN